MLCRDDIIRFWDVNVYTDELCECILAKFQQLSMNETIGEVGMFPNISHDFESVLGCKGLNETVLVHRSSKYFNALCREHVSCEAVNNICNVRVGVEEMFCTFKQMVYRGTLSKFLVLLILKTRFASFLKTGASMEMSLRDVDSFAMMLSSSV
jgi:hypothetical protein